MHTFPIAVYVPSVVGIALIAMTTMYRRNIKGAIYFSLMSYSIALWLSLQFIAQLRIDGLSDLLVVRASSAASNLFPVFFLLFISRYLDLKISDKLMAVIFGVFAALIAVNFSSLMITAVEVTPYGIAVKEAGLLYFGQILVTFGAYIYGLYKLFRKGRSVAKYERARYSLLFFGITQALVINVIGTTILVDSLLIQVAMVESFLAMIGFIAYAIVKHKLFDVKLIVARSLGYVMTLSTLVALYVALITLSTRLLGEASVSSGQQFLYIVATLVFGFSLSPLKKFFDRLTNRLFYRDAYDSQELLDRLNKILVGNIELDTILKETSDIMANTLKAEYVAFLIRETEGTSRRASFSKIVELDSDAILALVGKKKGKTELFVADEIEDDHDRHKIVLSKNNIAIAAKLAGSGAEKDQGYLLLGAKQSGNPYNKQDLQILDIIANELVIAIQNAVRFEEIETFNLTLQQKVNDATRQLRQTNEKLKALDETKDEFISMASHQLRTPLTAVKGYVSMVVEGDAGKLNKQQKELLDQAFASSQRMVYLIADLLNVSRLRSGKFVIENKPTMLADVVESEMEQLTDMANSKEQTLTYVKPDKFPTLAMDETKIRQVIMNFADNALHYTPNGGHIQINLEDKGDTIEYTVVDDGLGVPKSEQHHLFTKFFRAGNAKKARPDGTGLGLFMAKKVVIAQGGSIIFKSEENKGSTFGFVFPKAKMLVNDGKSEATVTEKDKPKTAKKTTSTPK